MSIIIQAGHISSNSNKLMQMLYERGLGVPIQSHTHGLSANEITAKLAKVLLKNSSIINTRIVDNLMVDLLLANLDQDDWGWADADNLDTLSYWQQVDENTRFILIFDSPKLLLRELLGQGITPELIENAISDWIIYHEKMLSFFDSHSKNCLLIEGDLAVNNLMNVKDQIQAIATNLKLKNNWQVQTSETEEILSVNPMFDIVANEILKQYPKCLSLYTALIEKSTVRLKNRQVPTKNDLVSLINSLNLFNEQEEFKKKLLAENVYFQTQLLALMTEKQGLEQKLQQNILLLEQDKNAVNAEQQAKQEKAEQENNLLIAQLHQVQEELERYYLENQKFDEIKSKLEQSAQQQAEKLEKFKKQKEDEVAKLTQQNKKLIQEKESLTNNQVSPQIKQENNLLIKQLHQVQEELERYYLENQRLKSQKQEPAKPVYYGAADRVKEDLPYRLGATMVSHSKSAKDLATLPLALAKEYRQFQKNQPADLPAIEEYQDANEAEKVKKHLSYRLGKTLVDGLKSPKSAIDLPVKLGKELVGFKNKG